VGTNDISSPSNGTNIAVIGAYQHPQYNGINDVTLLHLATAVPSNVHPITLSGPSDDDLEANGHAVTVSGWGDTTPIVGGGLLTSTDLRSVDLKIVTASSATRSTPRTRPRSSARAPR
jgi:hypothetical protein